MITGKNDVREPLFHVVARGDFSVKKAIGIRAIALLIALFVNAGFVFLVAGIAPFDLYATMLKGTFGNGIKIWSTISSTAILLCIALALGIAFKMRFWNVGGEGQVLMGALASAMVMLYLGNALPNAVLLLLMLLAGVLAGALWGVIPAFFKAQWNTNETLFTLMMNYVAIQLVAFFHNRWMGAKSSLGQINSITMKGWFPKIPVPLSGVPDQRGVLNAIVVLALMGLTYCYLTKTKHGYEIAVVGASQNTARYAGINVKKVILRTMAISGALCGLCGMMCVAGLDQTVSVNTAGGYGFTAIIVAWMSGLNPFLMLLLSLFVVFLERGTGQIANTYTSAGFNTNATAIVIGVVLFFMVGCEFFVRYRLVFRTKTRRCKPSADEIKREEEA